MEPDIKPERGQILPLMALVKRAIVSAFDTIFAKDIHVKLTNDKVFLSYFNNLSRKVEDANSNLKKIEVMGKSGIDKDAVSDAQKIDLHNKTIAQMAEIKEQLNHMPKALDGVMKALETIGKKDMVVNIPPFPKLEIPKTQTIEGSVKVTNQIELSSLAKAIERVEKAVKEIDIPEQKEVVFPKIDIPKPLSVVDIKSSKEILSSLKDLKKAIEEMPKNISFPEVEVPTSISVNNFPPQKYPIPPTNININPLRGYASSRAQTLTTTPRALPETVLSHRRSLILYNNSVQTIFIGGSDVTASNGLPVPRGSYSPPIDAGPRMIVYGVVASGSADVRVLEVSNDAVGSE